MQEIAEKVYIEEGYPRVVLGLVKLDHGMIMIDAPFRLEDAQSWRAKLRYSGLGMNSLLLLLDAHIDRTMTAQDMESDVIIHENARSILQNRTTSSKSHELEIGPDWTHIELPPDTRFVKPNMTFNNEVLIYWGKEPLIISHKSGAHSAGAWLIYDAQKVVFIGDSVVIDQPPFLGKADLPNWIKELNWLLSDRFAGYQIISSRNGLIQPASVRQMLALLTETKEGIDKLLEEGLPQRDVPELSSHLLNKIDFDPKYLDRYEHRLIRGIEGYLKRHHSKKDTDIIGEIQ